MPREWVWMRTDEIDDDLVDMYDFDDESDYSETPANESDSGSEASQGTEIGETSGPVADLSAALAAAPMQIDDFSFGAVAEDLPADPKLQIEGYGEVTLPLVDDKEAGKIIAICESSPFGQGEKTFVDSKVRNSYQLEPSKITIGSEEWAPGLEKLEKTIAKKLKLADVPVSLSLYKFLLYKEGGHFVRHRDTEKQPGMFGTVVVQLPSAHTGGQLLVYKEGAKRAISHDFGQKKGTAKTKCNYAVHYADAEHAVKPIESGYRLALVYSLCWPDAHNMPPPEVSLDKDSKDDLVAALKKLVKEERYFYYFLEHVYTPKSIASHGHKAFKSNDRSRIHALQEANAAIPDEDDRLEFLIAEAHRSCSYGAMGPSFKEAEWEEMDDAVNSIKKLYSIEGEVLETKEMRFYDKLDDDDFLNPDNKTRMGLWHGQSSTVYEGYLGNEGATRDTTYQKHLLVGVPRKMLDTYRLGFLDVKARLKSITGGKKKSSKTSEEELRKFLSDLAKSPTMKSRAPRASAELTKDEVNFRTALLTLISGNAAYHKLYINFLDLYPNAKALLADPFDMYNYSRKEQGVSDIVDSFEHDAMWQDEKVKERFARIVAEDIFRALEIVVIGLERKINTAAFNSYIQTFGTLLKDSSLEKAHLNFFTKLWTVALDPDVADLRDIAITRCLALDAEQLEICVTTLIFMQKEHSERLEANREGLKTLVTKAIELKRSELEKLSQPLEGWCFPDAVFELNAEIQAFLRSPESAKTFDIQVAKDSMEYSKYVSACFNSSRCSNVKKFAYSFKADLKELNDAGEVISDEAGDEDEMDGDEEQEGGKLVTIRLDVTKTDGYAKERAEECKRIEAYIGKLEKLLSSNAADAGTAGSSDALSEKKGARRLNSAGTSAATSQPAKKKTRASK